MAAPKAVSDKKEDRKTEAAAAVDVHEFRLGRFVEGMRSDIATFSAESRLSGTEGCDKAARYIERRFAEIGLERIGSQEFPVVVPITREMSFSVAGEAFELSPLWPNWVRTCTTRGTIEAPVIFAERGRMKDFNGKDVEGAIVVLDGDTGFDWFGAAMLGAEAIVFVEPETVDRSTCEKKLSSVPVNVPRFWIPRKRGLALVEKITSSTVQLAAKLRCRVDWEQRKARNIWAMLPGSEKDQADKCVAITAYYDSVSVAPDLAPGADSACGVAALLQTAEQLKADPPPRTTLFVAFAGHFQALAGPRAFADMVYVKHEPLLAQVVSLESSILKTAGLVRISWYQDAPKLVGAIALIVAVLGIVLLLWTRHKAFRGLVGAGALLALICAGTLVVRHLRLKAYGREFGVHRIEGLRRSFLDLEKETPEQFAKLQDILAAWEKRIEEAQSARRIYGAYAAERRTRLLGVELKKVEAALPGAKGEVRERLTADRDKISGEIKSLAQRMTKVEPGEGIELSPGDAAFNSAVDRAKGAPGAADLDRLAAAACDVMVTKCTHASYSWSAYHDIHAILRDVNGISKARNRPELKRLVDAIEPNVDKCVEDDKVVATDAIKYRRLLRNLRGLEAIGVETPDRLQFTFALDLSSNSHAIGVFYKGHYVNQWESGYERVPMKAVSGVSQRAVAFSEKIAGVVGRGGEDVLVDGVIGRGRHWTNYFSDHVAMDSEALMLSAKAALCLRSANDARPFVDTPVDTVDRVDFRRLGRQVDVLVPLLSQCLRDTGMLREYDDVVGRGLLKTGRVSRITGRSVRYDPRESMGIPNTPVPDLLMVSYRNPTGLARDRARLLFSSVRAPMLTCADERGNWEFIGASHRKARSWSDRNNRVEGYKFDPELGDIVFAPDRGEQGEAKFKPEVDVNKTEVPLTLVVFDCVDVSVFDLLDQRSYEMFTSIDLYDASTDSTPFVFGYRSTGETGGNRSYVEPAATLFLQNPTRLKVSFGHGLASGKYTLLNVPDGAGAGLGYYVGHETLADFEPEGTADHSWGAFDALSDEKVSQAKLPEGKGARCAMLTGGDVLSRVYDRPVDWTDFDVLRMRAFVPANGASIDVGLKTARCERAHSAAVPLRKGVTLVALRLSDLVGAKRDATGLTASRRPDDLAAVTGLQLKVSAPDALVVYLDDVVLESPRVVTHTPYKMARDLFNLDDFRIANLKAHSVSNDKVDDLHERAREALVLSQDAFRQKKYDEFVKQSRNAWGYEGRAYPSVQGTTIDILSGVLFYLFLLLPFSYFAERLLFAFADINRQILGFFGIFLAIFIVLWNVHPAFGVTNAAPIILLSFITLALSVLVLSMIRGRFELELNRLQQRPGTSKQQDMSRINASKTAFLLGISNMRRRKTRTALTLGTLVLLMFSILSFTSIRPTLQIQQRPILDLTRGKRAGVETKGLPFSDDFAGTQIDVAKWQPGGPIQAVDLAAGVAAITGPALQEKPSFTGLLKTDRLECADWLSVEAGVRAADARAGAYVMALVDESGNELGISYAPSGAEPGYKVLSVLRAGGGFFSSKGFLAGMIFVIASALLLAAHRHTDIQILRSWGTIGAVLAVLSFFSYLAPVGSEAGEKVHPPVGDETEAFHTWRIKLNPRTKDFMIYVGDQLIGRGKSPHMGGSYQWRVGFNADARRPGGEPADEETFELSVKSARAAQEKRDIPWRGVLIRARDWSVLSDSTYKNILTEFDPDDGNVVAPRAWKVSSQSSNITTSIKVANARKPEAVFYVTGVVGLSSDEPVVSKTQKLDNLSKGRWFAKGDGKVCVLSQRMAARLEMDTTRITGRTEGAPEVLLYGEALKVIGLTEDRSFRHKADIDTEGVSPVDFTQESWQKHRGREQSDDLSVYHYTHLNPLNVLWVPFDHLMHRGGTLRSVAVIPIRDLSKLVRGEILQKLEIPIFVAEEQRVTFESSLSRSTVSELSSLIVPVLIASLIVLNTMLGSVYEREREISIYGSLGLAPVHIASLFVAESCVFATVATVAGYVFGQVAAKFLTATSLLPGLNLNYSSKAAVFAAVFLIGVVLLSTLYPARRAGQLSVPDVERIWKFPVPDGDDLVFDFPFTMSGDQSLGMMQHLKKFFEDHSNQSVGEFYTAGSSFRARAPGGGPAADDSEYRAEHGVFLSSMVWIAPFDFGISQTLELETIPTDDEDVYEAKMVLRRASGETQAWVKMNHRFLKNLRKQFLVWRLFTIEERRYYANLAREDLGLPVTAAGAAPAEQTGDAAGTADALTGPEPA